MEPAGRAIHRVAAIRSRAVLAGDTWCVAIRTLHGAAQGVGGHASISRVRCGPERHAEWRHLCVTVCVDSNARPTAGTRGAVAATAVLDCDAAERAPRIHGDHSHAAAHAALEGAGPLRVARRARPHQAANRAAPRRRVPAPSWPSRPHAHHSSPHPRPGQLLLMDQQIASTLPLAQ
jgi:hypothetical protein